jgi:putative endonuclease
LVCYLGFASEASAKGFERYLKSGSGKTFLKRHFLPSQSTMREDDQG